MHELYAHLRQLVQGGKRAVLVSGCSQPYLGWEMVSCGDHIQCAPEQREFWQRVFPQLSEDGLHQTSEGEFFVQTITPTPRLIICGSGYIAAALSHLAVNLEFSTLVLDDRAQLFDQVSPKAETKCGTFPQVLEEVPVGSSDFYVIVTRGHAMDEVCLRTVLRRPHAYVGMIGSRTKVAAVKGHLASYGFGTEELEEVFAPIGLDIGAQTPEEIALSIAAQLVQQRARQGLGAGLPAQVVEAMGQPPFAMVTLLTKKGSAPRRPGTRMVVWPDGTTSGTIGGGKMELEVTQQAVQCLRNGVCVRGTAALTPEGGMLCGGTSEYLVVPVFREPK